MEGYYPVSYQGKPVGKVQVLRKGLSYSFHCRCRMESDIVCRLIAKWANGWENLGIPVPEGDGLELNRRLPAKRLGEEIGAEVHTDPMGRYAGALGAALIARGKQK